MLLPGANGFPSNVLSIPSIRPCQVYTRVNVADPQPALCQYAQCLLPSRTRGSPHANACFEILGVVWTFWVKCHILSPRAFKSAYHAYAICYGGHICLHYHVFIHVLSSPIDFYLVFSSGFAISLTCFQ